MLAAHPSLMSLPETNYFLSLVGDRERRMFGRAAVDDRSCVRCQLCDVRIAMGVTTRASKACLHRVQSQLGVTLSRMREPVSIRAGTRRFVQTLDEAAERSGMGGWVEKTPSHVHYVDVIRRYCPGSYVLHVIRRGEDVVASIWDARNKYPDSHWAIMYPSLDRCVARWNKAVRDSMKAVAWPNNIFIEFESLVENPAGVCEAICDQIGLSFSQDMVTKRSAALGAVADAGELWKQGVGKSLSTERKFEKVFTLEEQERVQATLASLDWAKGHVLHASSKYATR